MAYPNYFPVGYQPYYSTNTYQPVQPIQQTQPIQQSSSILWVRSSQEAAMYPVAPNAAVALWDSESPVIYLKKTDASGKPSMQTFDLVERTEAPTKDFSSSKGKDAYATKNDLAALASVVKGLERKVQKMAGDKNE